MPVQRGVRYRLEGAKSPESVGAIVLTTNLWNETMNQVGVVVVRSQLAPVEEAHAVPLASGGFAVVTRLVSEPAPGEANCIIGASELALPQDELNAVEDKLVRLLGLPSLLSAQPRTLPVLPGATPYPFWGDVYYVGPTFGGERKRHVVITSNQWNAVGGFAICVRTTTKFKGRPMQFPQILTHGREPRTYACCGDATTFPTHMFDLRDRPSGVTTARLDDMVAIARGLSVTHELAAAVARSSVP